MVSFRKSLLLIGLLVLVAGLASAQITPPLSCTANAGVPPLARAEGLAEEVGQVQIICTGGARAAQDTLLPTINVQIFLNTNLTSRIYSATSSVGGSEALLLVDEPAPTAQRLCTNINTGCPALANYSGVAAGVVPPPTAAELTYSGVTRNTGTTEVPINWPQANVFRAIHGKQTVQGLENSATFLGIPFNPPGTAGVRTLRIANVRANASQQAVLGAFGLPGSIQMVISISGTASLPLANPQLTVAFVQPGLLFTAGDKVFNQCDRPTGDSPEASSYYFDVKFQERFGTAFRVRGTESQNVPGAIYNTESMFTHTSNFGTAFGYASQATRLQAAFTGIPTGVSVALVPLASTLSLGANSGFVSGSSTRLSISGQAGTAVWNVLDANPNIIEAVDVRVYVWWSSTTTPGTGTATVRGDYSPQSTVNVATTGDAVPRFLPSQVTAGTFTIAPCQTNLLWPFVSNQAGFDTGLVISNTSLDPYGTVPQEGPCRVWYYGKTAAGATLNDWIDTPVVKAGEQFIWLLSASNPGAGFQGYIIARCNFQYAHGFGFISDLGAQKLAMGYLALVLDGQKTYADGRATRTAVRSETLGQ